MSSGLGIGRFRALSPAYSLSQHQTLSWLAEAHTHAERSLALRNGEDFSEHSFRERMTQLLNHFGCDANKIARRGVELSDCTHTNWSEMEIYRLDEQPTGRTALYRSRLYAERAYRAFEGLYAQEALPPTDLVHVTCTGYVSPSPAQRLVAQNGWHDRTRVTHAYHMGCYAALPALRIAAGFAAAPAELRPMGMPRVDIVHTEICSLHLNPSAHTPEQLVVQSLFADGFVSYSLSDLANQSGAPGFELLALADKILPESAEAMQWLCAEWGMQMTLARDVPERFAVALGAFVDELAERAHLARAALTEAFFAIHPGGPRILDRAQDLLALRDEQIAHSRAVLHQCGNMSSATLPHIWMSLLLDERVKGDSILISVAFGPGLTMCGAVMRKVAA